jgi:[ribosomal protein S18]-alanine N-acetyltransferase
MAEVIVTEPEFRLADINDLDAIMDVEIASFLVPWSRQAFCGELSENLYARYIVADLNGRIIGYAGVWIIFDEGHVTNIAIHPEFRGQKYGEKLVQELVRTARCYGANSMTLEVRVSNVGAQNLYKKLGFEPRGRRKGYYSDTKEDAIIMWKDDLGTGD